MRTHRTAGLLSFIGGEIFDAHSCNFRFASRRNPIADSIASFTFASGEERLKNRSNSIS